MKSQHLYSLEELRRTAFSKPKPIVEGILSEGESVLLVGKPKMGKSRLSQQLTLCVSRGESFLGMRVPEPRKVLYLDLENRPAGAQQRFCAMAEPHVGDARVRLYVPETLADNSFTATADGIVSLSQEVDAFQPDVLIIDPWRLFVGGNGNDEQTVMDGLKALSRLRQNHPKLAIILIHHLRKQQGDYKVSLRTDASSWVEAASGHYALIGHSDATYGLERELTNDSDQLIVFGGVSRAHQPPTLLLDEDESTLRFELSTDGNALAQLLTPAEAGIWHVAECLRRFNHGQLLTESGTSNKKAVSSCLRKAEGAGRLAREGKLYIVKPAADGFAAAA